MPFIYKRLCVYEIAENRLKIKLKTFKKTLKILLKKQQKLKTKKFFEFFVRGLGIFLILCGKFCGRNFPILANKIQKFKFCCYSNTNIRNLLEIIGDFVILWYNYYWNNRELWR